MLTTEAAPISSIEAAPTSDKANSEPNGLTS